ncbi:uncharacterized protein GGS25DRAFT_525944 [Hypoxylon fragiforme]|uniref:uncharacterized protein n=1 Tax=Hypoxylon fragiforme TaxID=63214 RepID=UPI0020C7384E|nr:uncharacterized protein GGS25DRAFT_525944 [Hypoxylon fragiforme]KAI2602918.1 hypothetical protein GGS25DRAFT_525944 [Hypoxylon fragiforme]
MAVNSMIASLLVLRPLMTLHPYYLYSSASNAAGIQAAVGSVVTVIVDSHRITEFIMGTNEIGLTINLEDGSIEYETFLSHKPNAAGRPQGETSIRRDKFENMFRRG